MIRLVGLVLLAALGSVESAEAGVVDRIAAVVNDDVITLSEVYDLGAPFIQQRCSKVNKSGSSSVVTCIAEAELEVLDSLIMRRLIRQKLADVGMAVTPEEIDQAIDRIIRDENFSDRETFKEAVTSQGWTWETYRSELQQQIQQMKFNQAFIMPNVQITNDELRDAYNRTTRQFASEPRRTLEALSVALDPEATEEERVQIVMKLAEVSKQLNAGERDWMATITELDSGVYAGRKGAMGSFKASELIAELSSVFEQEIDTISAPMVVGASVMLIKVVGESEGAVRPFDEVADTLRQQLFQERSAEEVEKWYQFERRRAAVRILLEKGS